MEPADEEACFFADFSEGALAQAASITEYLKLWATWRHLVLVNSIDERVFAEVMLIVASVCFLQTVLQVCLDILFTKSLDVSTLDILAAWDLLWIGLVLLRILGQCVIINDLFREQFESLQMLRTHIKPKVASTPVWHELIVEATGATTAVGRYRRESNVLYKHVDDSKPCIIYFEEFWKLSEGGHISEDFDFSWRDGEFSSSPMTWVSNAAGQCVVKTVKGDWHNAAEKVEEVCALLGAEELHSEGAATLFGFQIDAYKHCLAIATVLTPVVMQSMRLLHHMHTKAHGNL
jgi:hypothetical protein